MSATRKLTQNEKVLRALQQAGSWWLSADAITEKTGVPQPARRVNDLKNAGHKIEGKFLDRAKGIYGYRLVSLAEEPEEIPAALFDAPAPPTSHYDYEDVA